MKFQEFLSGIPARDYVFQKIPYEEQVQEAARMIKEAEYILVGGGAGLSAAAGLTYGGKRFEELLKFGLFLKQCKKKRTVLIELGVGFNTPVIIRFPFEKLVREHKNIRLIRLNLDEAVVPESFGKHAVGINADITRSMEDIRKAYSSL